MPPSVSLFNFRSCLWWEEPILQLAICCSWTMWNFCGWRAVKPGIRATNKLIKEGWSQIFPVYLKFANWFKNYGIVWLPAWWWQQNQMLWAVIIPYITGSWVKFVEVISKSNVLQNFCWQEVRPREVTAMNSSVQMSGCKRKWLWAHMQEHYTMMKVLEFRIHKDTVEIVSSLIH